MIKKIIFSVVTVFITYAVAFSHIGPDYGSRSGKKPNGKLAAGCLPASGANELNINNTRALIQTGGDMWWDFTRAQYEIPKNSSHTALFAGALWLGGRDISGQLKVAAQRFRSGGQDFWTGPLSTVDAEITQTTCAEYDKHFISTRLDIASYVAWFEIGRDDAANGTNKQAELFPDYTVPAILKDWPAHGRDYAPYNEDYNLAPFVDVDNNGEYNPGSGDYPAYDLNNSADCKARIINVYGDQNLWWVFNDMGNIHTESGSGSIGMEIRAQAFAFTTNDEVNNMTFYNYELVNRSTFTLADTYFGQWVDADLGCSQDDYVGCDVERGLGFAYNGDNDDEDCRGATGYGAIPPAIGVDFFQGPFQDADGIDNPLTEKYQDAISQKGVPYPGIGIGYGDKIIDNERFGMRKFLYHNNNSGVTGDPSRGTEYYNYLRSLWRDGSRMVYGGTGHVASGGTIEADYMFPDESDPLGWGTGGVPQPAWTEVTAGNTPFDRRFMQSAGPFVLEPGAVNNITVGIVWARASTGNNLSSVEVMRTADDKTQALFDNCFQLLNGPDAPDLFVEELENELILILENRVISNNYNELYQEQDPTLIPQPEDSIKTPEQENEFRTYRFQGYKVYQVVDNTVGANDLDDVSKARLLGQVDIKDGISRIINNYRDNDLGGKFVPKLEVDGKNKGIRKTFRITQDAFADGDNKLVNHKAYYFMALSYAYNGNSIDRAYLGSRKGTSGSIKPAKGIPHNIDLQNGGTVLNSKYGDGIEITRIEGSGNGGNILELKQTTIDKILANGKTDTLEYKKGFGPVSIKVIDPLKVKPGNFTIWFTDTSSIGNLTNASWMITNDKTIDTIRSTSTIELGTETVILDLGISINLSQSKKPGAKENRDLDQGILSISIEYQDSSAQWLTGVPDVDGTSSLNWIMSGTQSTANSATTRIDESAYDDWNYFQTTGTNSRKRGQGLDDGQIWEQQLSGTIAPFRMTAHKTTNGPIPKFLRAETHYEGAAVGADLRDFLWLYDYTAFGDSSYHLTIDSLNQLNYLSSIDIVFTSDKSKWTRCPVFEMRDSLHESDGNSIRGQLRDAFSVDKEGNSATDSTSSTNPKDANYIGGRGMGWFPGYAINIETGERLNMAFGEDSWLIAENGRDMLWNPTENLVEGPAYETRAGGVHMIYVFRNNDVEDEIFNIDMADPNRVGIPNIKFYNFEQNKPENRMPAYDNGKFIYEKMKNTHGYLTKYSASDKSDLPKLNDAMDVFRSGMYVLFPLLAYNQTLLKTDVTVKVRMDKPYRNRGAGSDYVSFGTPLVVGQEYYVNAGPVKHKHVIEVVNNTDSVYYSVYYSGQHFVASSTEWVPEYKDSKYGGNDSDNVLMKVINGGRPLYNFSTSDLAASFNNSTILEGLLGEIRVVPNPYYAYSEYEIDKIDNRIKIINLPKTVNVKIYTINGTLVRILKKDDDSVTSLEWDLKNQSKVPVSSGVYIIHVEAPGIGETVLKWMGVMRPVDLDNF